MLIYADIREHLH